MNLPTIPASCGVTITQVGSYFRSWEIKIVVQLLGLTCVGCIYSMHALSALRLEHFVFNDRFKHNKNGVHYMHTT